MDSINSSLFADMIDGDIDTGLYCPDFTLTRRPTKASTCRKPASVLSHATEVILEIQRPHSDDGMIPVTEIDDMLDMHDLTFSDNRYGTELHLGNHDMFNTVRDALDIYASNMVQKYDRQYDLIIKTYNVPVIGFLAMDKRDTSFGIGTEYAKSNRWSRDYYSHRRTENAGSDDIEYKEHRERFIIINGNKYSKNKTYKRHGGGYVPLNIPVDYSSASPIIYENEQNFRSDKKTNSKDIILNMPVEIELSGLSVHPEPLLFEQIHSTAIRCHDKCTKNKHCIQCLKNDPGYLISFKMSIRSSLTDGKWLSLGTFAGNNSIYDSHRISFDTILVKQIKIEPTLVHGTFQKVVLFPIGPSVGSGVASDEMFVTYIVNEPRSGKYVTVFDEIDRKFKRYDNRCTCDLCTGRKKTYKTKCRFLRDACADIDY